MRLRLLLCVVLLAVLACNTGGPSPDLVMADVGERQITFSDFDRYLTSNALQSEDDRVMSRMLDALVEQTVLLNEAEHQGLSISEEQIDLYLSQTPREGDDASIADVPRQQIRQRLMALKLEHALVGVLPEPTVLELMAHVEKMGWGEMRRLRLRSLRLDSVEDAARVSELIAAGQMTFDDGLATQQTDPHQGVPIDLPWETLSPEVQAAIENLQSGEVSAPVDFMGETFIFQLDSWLGGIELEDELLARARRQLVGSQEREARSRLLRKLSTAVPTRIHEEKLPFRYQASPG